MKTDNFIKEVKFESSGLVTTIAQEYQSGKILMVAYMNESTLDESLRIGKMVYWSRSRQKRWLKGEESGNLQMIREVRIDCDGDALLFLVDQVGGSACHTGYENCFYRKWKDERLEIDGLKVLYPDKK